MARLATILSKVRSTLADPSQERWTDARLLSLADDAQQFIVSQSEALYGSIWAPILASTANSAKVNLPSNCTRVRRVMYNNAQLIPISMAELDAAAPNWGATTGDTPTHWIYSLVEPQSFIVWPINPELSYPLSDSYGMVDDITDYTSIELYGSSMDFVSDGTVANQFFCQGMYGILTGTIEIENYLEIYYAREAVELTLVTDVPEMPRYIDSALRYYITGMAFLDSRDSMSVSLGNEQLQFFQIELKKIVELIKIAKSSTPRHDLNGVIYSKGI